MIILSANDLTKVYGTDVILENVSFHVNAGDKVGIIGLNGAGKSTLLNMISGELPIDGGNVYISQDTTVGFLHQKDDFSSDNTVIEEVMKIFEEVVELEKAIPEFSEEIAQATSSGEKSEEEIESMLHRLDNMQNRFEQAGGYTYKAEIKGVLSSMTFDEDSYDKKISYLSGGERTRLALACLLLKKPDILLLDEPTNHLDIDTLKWLEQYLRGYNGTVLIVSHDRYFLDQSVNRIFEIANHKLTIYEGNYSEYAVKRKEIRAAQMKAYQKQQTEIRRQEEMIRKMKERGTEKLAKRAASREKMLEHMERKDAPDSESAKMKLMFHENFKTGNDVLLAENIAKGFGYGSNRKELFKGASLDIKRGERVCIVGPNGVGKTTLLKIILGELEPDAGRIKYGYNLAFGYYDQGQRKLNDNLTVLEELKESYALYSDTEMRKILGSFLFRNDDVFLRVGDLSGGEKARLALVKIMLSGANVLVMDEPTNHLDIESKEVFEEALMDYPGTVIAVSHDRYFLNKIPTRILELDEDGMTEYLGRYDYYVEKKTQSENIPVKGEESDKKSDTTDSAAMRKAKKEQEAAERRLRREREGLEEKIAKLESEIAELENKLMDEDIMSDHVKLATISDAINDAKAELEEAFERWMELENE